jgi:hypothetical protein
MLPDSTESHHDPDRSWVRQASACPDVRLSDDTMKQFHGPPAHKLTAERVRDNLRSNKVGCPCGAVLVGVFQALNCRRLTMVTANSNPSVAELGS